MKININGKQVEADDDLFDRLAKAKKERKSLFNLKK